MPSDTTGLPAMRTVRFRSMTTKRRLTEPPLRIVLLANNVLAIFGCHDSARVADNPRARLVIRPAVEVVPRAARVIGRVEIPGPSIFGAGRWGIVSSRSPRATGVRTTCIGTTATIVRTASVGRATSPIPAGRRGSNRGGGAGGNRAGTDRSGAVAISGPPVVPARDARAAERGQRAADAGLGALDRE